MKLRVIGTGFAYCKHPFVPPAFLIQTTDANLLVGCPYQIVAKLESIGLSCDKVDMILLLGLKGHQAGGLEEFARRVEKLEGKTLLVAPSSLISSLKQHLVGILPRPLEHYFSVRSSQKISIKEDEYTSDTLIFLSMRAQDYSKNFGLLFSEANILISGESGDVSDYIWEESLKFILHDGLYDVAGNSRLVSRLQELPIYIQQKLWVYGYPDNYQELTDPMPMLFLPQGSCVFDSKRKEKYFEKERFIREMSKRQFGNKNPT